MADNLWQGSDGNWANAANWADGVPTADDIVRIFSTSLDITSGMAQNTINGLNIQIGRDFAGTLGTPADPLYIGTGTSIFINAPLARSINIRPSSASDIIVADTHTDPYSFYVPASGTITKMLVRKGQVRMGATADVTTLRCSHRGDRLNDVDLTLEAGLTVGTLYQGGGIIKSKTDIATVRLFGGLHISDGTTEGDVTDVEIYGGAEYRYEARGRTIATLRVFAGTFDASRDAYEKTIGTVHLWPDAVFNVDNHVQTIAITNPINYHGDPRVIGIPGRTVTVEAIPT